MVIGNVTFKKKFKRNGQPLNLYVSGAWTGNASLCKFHHVPKFAELQVCIMRQNMWSIEDYLAF